jgi:hypothetical protein
MIAGFLYRYFEWLSWIFVILMVVSLGYTMYGGYNYYKYGNCNGPESTGFCIFDPSGEDSQYAGIKTGYSGEMIWPIAGSDPSRGSKAATLTIIEFGCYACPYTKKAESIVAQLIKEYDGQINIVFKAFPLNKTHAFARETALGAECALGQEGYWEFHDLIFSSQGQVNSTDDLIAIASKAGLDVQQFDDCLKEANYDAIDLNFDEGVKAGVYGTPTFFIGKQTIVGPKPIEDFRKIINKELAKIEGAKG